MEEAPKETISDELFETLVTPSTGEKEVSKVLKLQPDRRARRNQRTVAAVMFAVWQSRPEEEKRRRLIYNKEDCKW